MSRTLSSRTVKLTEMNYEFYKLLARKRKPYVKLERMVMTNALQRKINKLSKKSITLVSDRYFQPMENFDHTTIKLSLNHICKWFVQRAAKVQFKWGKYLFNVDGTSNVIYNLTAMSSKIRVNCNRKKENELLFKCQLSCSKSEQLTLVAIENNGNISETDCFCQMGGYNLVCKHVAALCCAIHNFAKTGSIKVGLDVRRSRSKSGTPKKKESTSPEISISLQQLVNISMNAGAHSPAFLALLPKIDAKNGFHDYTTK